MARRSLLRQAQIEVQLGHHDEALARIDRLRASGQGGPGHGESRRADLRRAGQDRRGPQAASRGAVRGSPVPPELAGLDAAMQNKDGKPDEADRLLKEFLAEDPDNVTLTLMRGQILAESLKRPKEARELLLALAERCDNSSPLVQVAQIDMEQNDLDAAAETIARIRNALEGSRHWRHSRRTALRSSGTTSPCRAEHFDEALKKDPDNKIVQFWKAQLDSRTGSVSRGGQGA